VADAVRSALRPDALVGLAIARAQLQRDVGREGIRESRADGVDGEPAGDLTARVASHAIGDGEQPGVAGGADWLRQHRIFVVVAASDPARAANRDGNRPLFRQYHRIPPLSRTTFSP